MGEEEVGRNASGRKVREEEWRARAAWRKRVGVDLVRSVTVCMFADSFEIARSKDLCIIMFCIC